MCWANPDRSILYFCGGVCREICSAIVLQKRTTNQQNRKKKVQMRELNLQVERLEQRIAPGLLDGVTICVTLPSTDCTGSTDTSSGCPPPSDSCPPPSDSCPPPSDTSGGNNGYGNGGYDGVPGSSADNGSPNADEKAADQVR